MSATLSSSMNRRVLLKLAGIGLGGLLASCAGSETASSGAATASLSAASVRASSAAPSTSAAPASLQPKAGGTLRIGSLDITNLDGHGTVNGTSTVGLMFDHLTAFDAKTQPQPVLAQSWELSPDGKQLTLHLRQGVPFHSGREMTSEDVRWNLMRAHSDPTAGTGGLRNYSTPLASVDAPDKYTVQIKSGSPWPGIFNFFEILNILDPQSPDQKTRPSGTGPFVLQDWLSGDHLTLARNKNYWQKDRPYVDSVAVNVFHDPQAMTAQLEGNAIDIMDSLASVDAARLKKDAHYTLWVEQSASVFLALIPNVAQPPLDNKQVRQALGYAINRARIVQSVQLGFGQPADLPWPASSPAYDAAKNAYYNFDLNKTKSLLAAAHVPNLEFEMVYRSNAADQASVAQIMQSDLASIGVKVDLRPLDPATFSQEVVENHKFAGFELGNIPLTNGQPSGIGTNFFYGPLNPAQFKDPAYFKLLDTMAAETDPAKQKMLYSQFNDFVLDACFCMVYSSSPQKVASSTQVQGVRFSGFGPQYRDVWLA